MQTLSENPVEMHPWICLLVNVVTFSLLDMLASLERLFIPFIVPTYEIWYFKYCFLFLCIIFFRLICQCLFVWFKNLFLMAATVAGVFSFVAFFFDIQCLLFGGVFQRLLRLILPAFNRYRSFSGWLGFSFVYSFSSFQPFVCFCTIATCRCIITPVRVVIFPCVFKCLGYFFSYNFSCSQKARSLYCCLLSCL